MHASSSPYVATTTADTQITTMYAFVHACIVDDDAFMNVCMGM